MIATVPVVGIAACVVNNTPAPITGPGTDPTQVATSNPPTLDASAPTPPSTATPDSGAVTPPTTTDAGGATPPSPDAVYACSTDGDCTAVAKKMCCPDGTMEAVNSQQVDAYNKAWNQGACPPVACPAIKKQDTRVAECSNTSHKCEMVAIDQIACMGFINNQHKCPTGYTCKKSTTPDIPGKCVK